MNDDSVINFLKAAAFLVGFFFLDYLLYRLLTLQVHVDPPEFPLHEQPQGGGGNGNRAGQREDHPEQLAAQDGDGEGEAEAEDDPQQEADIGDGEGEGGGGGDQQEDDGSHHQHLPLLLHHRNVLPGNDRNHDAPRTDKVEPIQDRTLPIQDRTERNYS
ncbi:uncharacterized protein [Arachis hypogaea]|uniref:uncharacterized protein n=1 Tax=Arachis hypogaea TaxID=3818 RepID=UPI000A2C339D|nr:uncharacterized protein LOC112703980 [Arachis hypogaea]